MGSKWGSPYFGKLQFFVFGVPGEFRGFSGANSEESNGKEDGTWNGS